MLGLGKSDLEDLPSRGVTANEADRLSWLQQKYSQGISILRKEPAFRDMNRCIDYLEGSQDPKRPVALSHLYNNRIKKIVQETTSGLTDVRPIWNYETVNDKYKDQATILNKLARGWWKNQLVDRKLVAALTLSCVGGSGYIGVTWDPTLPGGGDIRPIPFDPRDVIPIDPVFTESIQDWRGVILRQTVAIEDVRSMYPTKAHKLVSVSSNSWGRLESARGKDSFSISTPFKMISKLASTSPKDNHYTVDLMRVFLKDESLNTGSESVLMQSNIGDGYWVHPLGTKHPDTGEIIGRAEAKLYPRGRMIVCTPDAILEDGPNPYWHGLFPVVRFSLEPFPWLLLGTALVSDLVPLQEALNEAIRGLDDGIAQWVNRSVVADKGSLAEATLANLDTRRPGNKLRLNPVQGEGFKQLDGPQFPNWFMDFIKFLAEQMDENSGVKGMRSLAQMKDGPGVENVEKFMETLSPLLRLRSRSIELSLFELAEIIKVNFLQFYSQPRRIQMLGKKGVGLEEFDYDPTSLVPAETKEDKEKSRYERARDFHRSFTFTVAPNSFLNVAHTTQKLLILQLFRANGVDIWTMWEAMDLQGVGAMPAETIPERMVEARRQGLQPGATPELIQAQQEAALAAARIQTAQAQQALQQVNSGPKIAPSGAPPTSGVGPQGGRPPSGQSPPQLVTKDGGQRVAVSESGA